jgi:pepsin A
VVGIIVEVGEDRVDQREDDKTQKGHTDGVELYHPGSPPSYITRLGRFHHDKDAMALLIKAETALKKRVMPASLEQTVEKPSVLVMPSSYHKALRDHQREHRHGAMRDISQAHQPKREPAMVQGAQVPIADSSAEGVPISNGEDPSNNAGGADSVIMPLKLLRSEYMGPMGVGTMVPKHCRQDGMSAMAGVSASTRHGRRHRRNTRPSGLQAQEVFVEEIGDDVSALEADSSPWRRRDRKQRHSPHAELHDHASEAIYDLAAAAMDELSFSSANPASNSSCVARQQTYLNVVYDTGSTNIWISSDLCTSGGCVLPGRRRFNHLESTTFSFPKDSPTLSVQFGTGKLSGPLGTDNLRVGPVSVHQTFAMMQNQAGWIWEDVPIEGIVGLGFPSLANTDGHPPFFDSVIQQKALKRNEFAFYVSRENPAANAIMWGGVDSRFYSGSIEWFQVVDPHYWALELVQFRVGNVSFHFSQAQRSHLYSAASLIEKPKKHGPVVVLDTGTSVLGFSSVVLSNLTMLLPEAPCIEVLQDGANGAELKYPDMVFVLRNKAGLLRDWTLTGRQYMSRDEEGDMCSPSIMTLDLPPEHGPGLVLGDVFLREYFSVYSRRDGTPEAADIGLARSRRTEDVVDHLKSLTGDQESLLHT